MKPTDLNTTSDAHEWVRQFFENFPECEVNPDTVVAWFASALLRGRSDGYRAGYLAGLGDSQNVGTVRRSELGYRIARTLDSKAAVAAIARRLWPADALDRKEGRETVREVLRLALKLKP